MNDDVEMLQYIYENASMGKSTIDQIIKSIKDLEFYDVLNEQLKDYEKVKKEASKLLKKYNTCGKDISNMLKIMAYMNIKLDLAIDSTSSHVAEMLVKGSNTGIIEITKNINHYNDVNEEIKELGKKLLSIEENNYNRLQKYL